MTCVQIGQDLFELRIRDKLEIDSVFGARMRRFGLVERRVARQHGAEVFAARDEYVTVGGDYLTVAFEVDVGE